MPDNEIVKKRNKFEIIALVIAITIIVTALAGLTYSFFAVGIDRTGEQDRNRVMAGNLDIDFSLTGSAVNTTEFFPIDGSTDELFRTNAAIDGNKLTFTVGNPNEAPASGRPLRYEVILTGITISDNLRSPDFKWQLYNGDERIATGHFGTYTGTGDIILATNIEIGYGDVHNLEFYLAIVNRPITSPQDQENFNKLTGGNINARIKIIATF